jgi:hypothetical protein
MAEGSGERIRVILRMVQIHDDLEPAWEDEGEFRFTATVSSRNRGGIEVKTVLPSEDGHYKIMDNPAWNRLQLDKTLFEGEVDDHLDVKIIGEELDFLSANDQLDPYHRVFEGDPSSWVGYYHPGDEGSGDPERRSNWWIYLEVEPA